MTQAESRSRTAVPSWASRDATDTARFLLVVRYRKGVKTLELGILWSWIGTGIEIGGGKCFRGAGCAFGSGGGCIDFGLESGVFTGTVGCHI